MIAKAKARVVKDRLEVSQITRGILMQYTMGDLEKLTGNHGIILATKKMLAGHVFRRRTLHHMTHNKLCDILERNTSSRPTHAH
jgi:hypothetical protein